MRSPVLKRRLNPFLLASTVLVLSLLAGLSVMYQGQLSDMLSDKKTLQEKLEDKNKELSDLQAENANLTAELEQKGSQVTELSRESNKLESDVETLEDKVGELETENSELEDRASDLESSIENLNESLELVCFEDWSNMTESSQTQCLQHGHDYSDSG